MLSIRLLGAPQVTLGERPVALRRRKSRALLYYLADQGEAVARERLAELLWPGMERGAGLQGLRTALYALRRALGNALAIAEDTLDLAPGVAVDVRLFRDSLEPPTVDPAQLAPALALYRGDFLDGFSLPDSPAFDQWQTLSQERYRRLAVRGFTLLSRRHEEARSAAAALEALGRALELDPLQEDLQRAALRLHALVGDRVGAIRRYEAFRQLLDQEMGVPPLAETRAVYDAIINDRPLPERRTPAGFPPYAAASGRAGEAEAPASGEAPALPFSGRAVELQAVRAAAADRRLALIEGPAGIGKTRLAEEFLRSAGGLHLNGAAHDLEQALPYQPVIDALRGLVSRPDWPGLAGRLEMAPVWWSEIARLLPELGAPARQPPARFPAGTEAVVAVDESRLWEGVHQFLTGVARLQPWTLFLDDLHWADAATLGLLAYLVRRSRADRTTAAFVAAAQPAPARSPLAKFLQRLTRADALQWVRLERLSSADINAIAAGLCASSAESLAAWLERVSEGNPYILHEMVRHARKAGVLRPDGAVDEAWLNVETGAAIPRTVYSLIQARLDRLSDGARRVLDAAVAAGREFEFAVVARAAGLSEEAALDALAELRALGLVAPSAGNRYAFDHNLTMEVAYREIGEERHRMLHRRVAEAAESIHRHDLETVAAALAFHFGEAGLAERAADYAWRAGRRAASVAAWTEAIGLFEQALAAETDSARRGEILIALGEARQFRGEAALAAEHLREALRLARARGDRPAAETARLGLIAAYMPQARYAEVIELIREMQAEGQPANQAQAERLWALALMAEGADLGEALAHLQKARRLLAEQAQDDVNLLAFVEFETGNVRAERGDLAEAVQHYRRALEAAEAAATPQALRMQALAHNNLAYHLHLIDPLDPEAEAHGLAGLECARAGGALGEMPFLYSTLGEIALARGDLADAERLFEEGLALAEQFDMRGQAAGLEANLGLAAARRGETALAAHRLTAALAQAEAVADLHLAARIHLWLAPLLPPAEARRHLAAARTIAEHGGRRLLLAEAARSEASLPPA